MELWQQLLFLCPMLLVAGIIDGISGGFNFDAKNRRPSNTPEDMFHAFILGMDTFALGLIKAARLIEEGELDTFVEKRYASFKTELGEKIRNGEATLKELADRAARMGSCETPESSRQEYLQSIVNKALFG